MEEQIEIKEKRIKELEKMYKELVKRYEIQNNELLQYKIKFGGIIDEKNRHGNSKKRITKYK